MDTLEYPLDMNSQERSYEALLPEGFIKPTSLWWVPFVFGGWLTGHATHSLRKISKTTFYCYSKLVASAVQDFFWPHSGHTILGSLAGLLKPCWPPSIMGLMRYALMMVFVNIGGTSDPSGNCLQDAIPEERRSNVSSLGVFVLERGLGCTWRIHPS